MWVTVQLEEPSGEEENSPSLIITMVVYPGRYLQSEQNRFTCVSSELEMNTKKINKHDHHQKA